MNRSTGWQLGLLCVLGTIVPAAQAETVFTLYDEATGKTGVYSAASHRMSFSGTGSSIYLGMEHSSDHQRSPNTFENLYASLAPPPGANFTHGVYTDAGCRGATTGRAAGIQVTLDNPLCSDGPDRLWGWISIRQLELDTAGRITKLEAAFSQRQRSPDAPGWVMTLHHNTKPQSFTINTGRQTPFGAVRHTFYGDEALFTLSGSNSWAGYSAAAPKNDWFVYVSGPEGQRLRKGRYTTGAYNSTTAWKMQVARGRRSHEVQCNGPGTLDVADVEYDTSGQLVALRATFQQSCNPDQRVRFNAHTGAVGEIRYNR